MVDAKTEAKAALFKAMNMAQSKGAPPKGGSGDDGDGHDDAGTVGGGSSDDSNVSAGTKGTFTFSPTVSGASNRSPGTVFNVDVTTHSKEANSLLLAVFDAITLVQ